MGSTDAASTLLSGIDLSSFSSAGATLGATVLAVALVIAAVSFGKKFIGKAP